jgi:hypothetical protein
MFCMIAWFEIRLDTPRSQTEARAELKADAALIVGGRKHRFDPQPADPHT